MDTYPSKTQALALKSLMLDMGASRVTYGLDECGDPKLQGTWGRVYAVPEGFQVVVYCDSVRQWSHLKVKLPFGKVTADCDREGLISVPNSITSEEAQRLRQVLGIRKAKVYSEEGRLACLKVWEKGGLRDQGRQSLTLELP